MRCAMNTLGARIKVAADKVGGLDVLAQLIPDMSRRSLSDYVNDKTDPRASLVVRIAAETGTDAGWLLSGEGEMRLPGARLLDIATPASERLLKARIHRPVIHDLTEAMASSNQAQGSASADFIQLPFYQDLSASAGHGLAVPSEYPDSVIAFARHFLRDQGAAPDRCSVIRAKGDSMVPTIPDASLLVVDHSQIEISNGCIMVINVGGDLLVKRIRRRLDGLIELISDNPAYPPETIGRDTIEQLRVVGRVVYFGRVP